MSEGTGNRKEQKNTETEKQQPISSCMREPSLLCPACRCPKLFGDIPLLLASWGEGGDGNTTQVIDCIELRWPITRKAKTKTKREKQNEVGYLGFVQRQMLFHGPVKRTQHFRVDGDQLRES